MNITNDFNSRERWLGVGVHPDELVLAMGASINRFMVEKLNLTCICLTRGEKGGDPKIRMEELFHGLTYLGISEKNINIASFHDCHVEDDYETISYLEKFLDPSVVGAFIPSGHDRHPDHRKTFFACLAAFRHFPNLISYETPSKTAEFHPTAFIEINEEDLHRKCEAINYHKTQMQKKYVSRKAIVSRAITGGELFGVQLAEIFEIVRVQINLQPNFGSDSQILNKCSNSFSERKAANNGCRC